MQHSIWLSLLVVLVTASAVTVVYARHLNRTVFIDLQQLQQQRDAMNVEWGKLQLEQSTFATHSKIESVARQRLGMQMPNIEEIKMVRP